jgi:hypothetical protein
MVPRPALAGRRAVRTALTAIAVLACCVLVWQPASAVFSDLTANPGNTMAAGTVSLSDDDSSDTRMFNVSGLRPGDSGSRCLRVTYTGSAEAMVKLYTTASSYTGTLGAYLDLTISEGPAGTFANASCADWTTGRTIFDDTFVAFATQHTGYPTGLYNSGGIWTPTANAQYRVYKFTYTFRSSAPSGTQNSGAGIGFTWQARSTRSTNLALNKPATGTLACAAAEGVERAVNGSMTDKFCSNVAGKYLQVDLGAVYAVGSFTVRHASAGGESRIFNTRDYDIDLSTDGAAWTNAVQARTNVAQVSWHSIAPSTARYVRLAIVQGQQDSNATVRIYEFEVWQAATPPLANLALNRTTTSSTPCMAGEGADKAVNGGFGDKLCTGAATKYLQVDLGSTQSIASVILRHAGAGGEDRDLNTRDFDIGFSTDGTTWTNVVQTRGNAASVTIHPVAASARYVRLTSIYAEQINDLCLRVYEFEIYAE